MSDSKIKMKLLVDKSKHKVLFAEARKECIDFLFHILQLPLVTVAGLLTKESMAGSIGNIYESIDNLCTDYFEEGINKDNLLSLKPATVGPPNIPLLTINPTPDREPDVSSKSFYTCSNIYPIGHNAHKCVSDYGGANCQSCGRQMTVLLTYVAPPTVTQTKGPNVTGYVKGATTYMIMDDLSVQPMSMVSSIALLNKFNVQDVGSLEEREVSLDASLGLALLKASLMSSSVLTDVFVVKKLDIDRRTEMHITVIDAMI